VDKLRFSGKPQGRLDAMLEYLRMHAQVRDVVVSGGDVANMPGERKRRRLNRLRVIPVRGCVVGVVGACGTG